MRLTVMRTIQQKNYKFMWLAVTIVVCASMVGVFADSPADIPPPKAKYNDKTLCVEPVEIMRKQHFEFILGHRDRTVIEGIRTTQYSLNACIDCHITPNAQGKYARYSEETHFCADCHQFAAVSIDCFQCHADRPKEAIRKSTDLNGAIKNSMRALHENLQLSDLRSQKPSANDK